METKRQRKIQNNKVEPYFLEKATLVTYSGKHIDVDFQCEKILTEPLFKVKNQILDSFVQMCKTSKDPFVNIINVKTKPAFSTTTKKLQDK